MKNRNNYAAKISMPAVVAALYICLTIGLKPISYGAVQFRIAEVLNLLAFISPIYGLGVTLGCFVSNIFSDLGLIDAIVGTVATALAVCCIHKSKNLFIASLWPTIFSSVLVGLELTYLFKTPIWFNIGSVALGQFVVMSLIGYPFFKYLIKHEAIVHILRCGGSLRHKQ